MRLIGLAVVLAVGLLASPFAVEAQQAGKMYRIGLLGLSSRSDITGLAALREGLRDLGYEEGKNLVIEYRWAEGRYDRLPGFADELVRLKVDVLVPYATPGARAAKQATTTIPVVVAMMGDAVAMGIVPSLARPGGNITGSQFHFPELMGKRVEMLREAIPRLARVAVLFNPTNPSLPPALKIMEETARSLGIELQRIEAPGPQDFDGAFAAMAQRRSEGFVVSDDPVLRSHGRAIAELAAKRRLPSVGEREYAEGPVGLRSEPTRGVAPGGGVHRQDLEGCEARRSACRAGLQVRVGGQSQDRQGAGADDPAVGAAADLVRLNVEWEVASRPYVTNAGKDVHVRVRRVDNAEVTMIRTWSAHERIAVKRDSGKGDG